MDVPEFTITNEVGNAYLNVEMLELDHICQTCVANRRFTEHGNPVTCTIPSERKHLCHFVKKYREKPGFAEEMDLMLVAERLYLLRRRVNAGEITKRDALIAWGVKRVNKYNDMMVDAEYQRIIVDGNI